ncbi:MAG: isoprenylcysteine carboxylmethyltransferase family protein [Planctomycetes bacterium]|nr:isoprenylcysteine carboxylmethyltransferase family protein [Planctomycetota bacterium]
MSLAATPVPKARPKSLLAVLVRRRIALSMMIFGGLITSAFLRGVRPHDLLNFRDPFSMVGLLLVVLGVAMRSWAAGTLTKSTQLTTTGPYRLVRNPLYLGSFLMLIGFCLVIGDVWILAVGLVPLTVLYFLKVRAEERFLKGKFGADWIAFASRTPRLVPRSIPRGDGSWRFAQWLDNREYQASLTAVAALVALQIWSLGLIGR